MVATYQQFDLAAGWTGAQLMTAIEDAYVAAGIETGSATDKWNDSGYEHCVVALDYDNTKAHGVQHNWWMYSSSSLYWSYAVGGWDAVGHQPQGTQHADYFNTSSVTTSWHDQVISLSESTSAFIRVYTSGVNSNFHFFQLRNGNNAAVWFHVPENATFQSWVDFDLNSVNGTHFPGFYQTGYYTITHFAQQLGLRRDLHTGTAMYNSTSSSYKSYWRHSHFHYGFWGKRSNNTSNWQTNSNQSEIGDMDQNSLPTSVIGMPTDFSANNDNYATPRNPVFSGVGYNAYITEGLPSDFGIAATDTNGMNPGDRLVVDPGVEEWEILARRNHSGSVDYSNGVICCRVV